MKFRYDLVQDCVSVQLQGLFLPILCFSFCCCVLHGYGIWDLEKNDPFRDLVTSLNLPLKEK